MVFVYSEDLPKNQSTQNKNFIPSSNDSREILFKPKTKIQSSIKPFKPSALEKFLTLKKSQLSKHFDDKSYKPLIKLITCGHVDAGKSTLIGHLLYNLGTINKNEIHKTNKECKETNNNTSRFAWLMDVDSTERDHGVTIGVCNRNFETDNRRVVMIDCPGHRDFTNNLLTDITEADGALLVVDSNPTNFENGFSDDGQTKEHVLLVRSMGVRKIIVAINKMDVIERNQKETFGSIKTKISQFLEAQKFNSIQYIPISALKDQNLTKSGFFKDWYKGETLLQAIESIKISKRDLDLPSRFVVSSIDHSFQHGNTVSGTLISGTIMKGEKMIVMPINFMVEIKVIYCQSKEVEIAIAGDYIEVKFTNDRKLIQPGHIVCDISNPVPVVNEFEINIFTFKLQLPVIKGEQLILYVPNDEVVCTVEKILNTTSKRKGTNKRPNCITSQSQANLIVRTANYVCLESDKKFKRLTRVILRRKQNTVAIGTVTELIK